MNPIKVSACVLSAACAIFLTVANLGAQVPVPLGTASTYGVLAGSTVTNTGPTIVSGDLGVSPGTAVTGFPPGTVTGAIRTDGAAAAAKTDLLTAYNDAAGQPSVTVAAQLGGQTFIAGVYSSATGFLINGVLTLDGQNNPNSLFIFQTGASSALITAAGAPGLPASQVVLINGAQPGNVFFQVGSSATLGTYSVFMGNILASSSITLTTGATMVGRALALNGAVTLDTNTVIVPGSITVVKNTAGGDGTFAFTSNFGLASLTTGGGTASQTFSALTPGGAYSVSETVPAGWTQTSATCTNGTPAAITVVSGATTTCTIINTLVAPPAVGAITVVKNTVGGDGTFAFTSNFGLTSMTTAGGAATQAFGGLTPGSAYNVSETAAAGWTQTSATCTSGTPSAVIVAAGATTTCTFVNTVVAPPPTGSIMVVKNTVGGNGTFAFASDFGLTFMTTVGGTASQTFNGLTPGGSYSLSETVPLPVGWTQTSASCTNGTIAAIVVAAGATTTCVITNTLGAPPVGTITIVKNAVGGNGSFAFTSNFGLTSMTTIGGTASRTFGGLTPGGGYSVSEAVPPGWTQTGATCTNGTPAAIVVVAGATTTCTITNAIVAPVAPDLVIAKSHVGNFVYGDTGDAYSLTVGNIGQGPTTGVVTVTDALPAGLTATAIGGAGWICTLAPLTCQRSDALGAGASYPVITVTVNVASSSSIFNPTAGGPGFQTGDILLSIADGTVQWRRHDFSLVAVLPADPGEAKGMAFDSSGNLYVTHWYGAALSGNNVEVFNHLGNPVGTFGGGFNCNPTSISFDNGGNAYVGQADCGAQALKFDPLGNPLAQYNVAVENRGSEHVVLDPNQCTMYYTSEGADVKQFNVCTSTQMPNFNAAPLPDSAEGGQQFSPLPGGGILVADFSVIARLDASGNLVTTYGGVGGHCWLGMALDPDGVSFWASDWCSSVVTHFDMATGNVIDSYVADPTGFTVKQICIPIFISNNTVVTAVNTATVAGGGESNTGNDSASDVTTIDPSMPATPTPTGGVVNAASDAPIVAAGSIASLFGSGLSSGQAIASGAPLPDSLASSFLGIGSQIAPLLSASPNRVNMQIPWGLAGQTQATVTGTVGAVSFAPIVTIAPFAPGIFTLAEADSGLAPFVPALFTLNETNPSQGLVTTAGSQVLAGGGGTPVAPGAFISIYCTGLGAVSNQPATGAAAQASPLSVTTTAPTVTIGGIAAPVSFSGLAPGAVGLYLVTVQVPAEAPAGNAVPVVLTIGGVASNTVTIVVQ